MFLQQITNLLLFAIEAGDLLDLVKLIIRVYLIDKINKKTTILSCIMVSLAITNYILGAHLLERV